MQARTLVVSLVPLFSMYFVACGGSKSPPTNQTPDIATLQGDWHLTGTRGSNGFSFSQLPFLTLSIGVAGNTAYGLGEYVAACSSSSAAGGPLVVTGPIAADGSFVLTTPAISLSIPQTTIRGNVPASAASTWEGSYSISNTSTTLCPFNATGEFVATAYPPLNGSYSGTVVSLSSTIISGQPPASGLQLTLQIAQAPWERTATTSPTPYLPLTGAIAVSGSPCFSSGTALSSGGALAGDTIAMTFAMDDGSMFLINGYFTDATEGTIRLVLASDANGKCSGMWSGNVVKQ